MVQPKLVPIVAEASMGCHPTLEQWAWVCQEPWKLFLRRSWLGKRLLLKAAHCTVYPLILCSNADSIHQLSWTGAFSPSIPVISCTLFHRSFGSTIGLLFEKLEAFFELVICAIRWAIKSAASIFPLLISLFFLLSRYFICGVTYGGSSFVAVMLLTH